ncbi:MAG: BMP family ABC transporter substrate-binding protein [Olegusella sp.]|jgi:basic membrane protein A|nr:BMP family ABC transporter substrate-binding protein [Olegusella sp.]
MSQISFGRREFLKGSSVAVGAGLLGGLAGCGGGSGAAASGSGSAAASDFKAGFIFLHDENSTYDKNFMDAAKAACEELGVKAVLKTNIDESEACQQAAEELADQGCGIVFADSFGHEDYMIEAAKEFTDVQFSHATGTKAHTEGLDNYHNAFASIYEGRYLAGVAAGLKLNEMIADGTITEDKAHMGYVGAFTYAEVISGYTSFYLGAKSVCPSVTMDVTFTGSWYDQSAEQEAAARLIDEYGCVLISQHADSMGAPSACEERNVPNVSYNGSTIDACPNTFIVSSRIDWTPYYKYAIQAAMNGDSIDTDWTGDLSTGSVLLTDINTDVAAEGTQDAIDKALKDLESGDLHVFDTSTFTVTVDDKKNANAKVDGSGVLTSYMADVDTDEAFEGDTEAVSDGYFHESEYRSAPYFDVQIDGINLLDTQF